MKEVIVVGGGAIGLAIAYYAQQKGHRVTLIERGARERDGCSFGNAGMIVPSHFIPLAAPGIVALGFRMLANPKGPFAIRPRLSWNLMKWGWRFCRAATRAHVRRTAPLLRDLNLASRQCFIDLGTRLSPSFGLTNQGMLMMCKTAAMLHEETHAAHLARELGIPAEILDAAEAARRCPGVDLSILGAIYYPQDAHLTPEQFVPRLTEAVEQGGARMLWETACEGFDSHHGKIQGVRTTRGLISGDEYVLAAGSWSDTLTQGLKLDLPLQPGKGYSVTMPNAPQRPPMGCILTEARVAITPMMSGLRIGGTMEITTPDAPTNPRRVQGIFESVPRYFPGYKSTDFEALPVWSGLRPCSPDGLPYLGRTRHYRNLSVATGHAMMGLSLAPITGKLMAEVISDESPMIDMTLLRPDRYASRPNAR